MIFKYNEAGEIDGFSLEGRMKLDTDYSLMKDNVQDIIVENRPSDLNARDIAQYTVDG